MKVTSQRGGVSNLIGWHRAGLVKGFVVLVHSGHAPKRWGYLRGSISLMINVRTQAEKLRPLSLAFFLALAYSALGNSKDRTSFLLLFMGAYIRVTYATRQINSMKFYCFFMACVWGQK